MSNIIIAIPARLESQRLPNKVLADIAGLPMIVRVARQCLKTQTAQNAKVVIATDSTKVIEVAKQFQIEAILTAECNSGTERCQQLVEILALKTTDIVINVQGDEPLIPPENIDQLATIMQNKHSIDCATLYESITSNEQLDNPNVVKVVVDKNQFALYFSRHPIPYNRSANAAALSLYKRHVGIYAYRVQLLKNLTQLLPSTLEQSEKLEQLRLLENGQSIYIDKAKMPNPSGIDTAADLMKISSFIMSQKSV